MNIHCQKKISNSMSMNEKVKDYVLDRMNITPGGNITKHNCNKCQKPQYKLFLIMIEIHVNWENGRQLRFTRYQAGMLSN